jgi:hypothetical protein
MKKPQLQVFRSLAPEFTVGWKRADLPMVHGFAQALPGTAFQPSDGHGTGVHIGLARYVTTMVTLRRIFTGTW